MPIEVFQVDNLFGSNEAYEFPNALPSDFVDQDTLNLKPRMSGYYSGTIALKGGHWNWCRYKNIYFQLRKVRLLSDNEDVKKQRGQYALIRDMWVNTVLSNTITVKGDLGTGNIDDQLIENINKTFGMVEKPVEIYWIPFKETVFTDGKSELKDNPQGIKEITLKPIELVMSRKFFDLIKAKTKQLQGFKFATKYLYQRRKDIYIFGFLKPAQNPEGGKKKVIDRINKSLGDLLTDSNRRVVKVTTPTSNNRLLNHYALSYANASIGTADDTMVLQSLDLSGVTDIVPVNGRDLKEQTPTNLITDLSAVFDFDDATNYDGWDNAGKLARNFYAPSGYRGAECFFNGLINDKPAPRTGGGGFNDNIGQAIELKDWEYPDRTKVGHFYGLDRIDFALTGYKGKLDTKKTSLKELAKPQKTKAIAEARLSGSPVMSYLAKHFYTEVTEIKDVSYGQGGGVITPLGWGIDWLDLASLPFAAEDTTTQKENIWDRMDRPAPYGVLMWQTQRPGHKGERAEYLGDEPVKKLLGYSGINGDKFYEKYANSKSQEWGAQTQGTQLGNLCCDEYVSRFFLDLDFFSWIYFTPKVAYGEDYTDSRRGASYYLRPDFYYDNYKIYEFVKHYTKTFYWGIPIAAGLQGIRNPANGQIVNVPFTNTDYPLYSIERTRKIDDVFLLSELNLTNIEGKDFTIKKGDFFCSSLEYGWRKGTPSIWVNDEDAYKNITVEPVSLTSNTLEDFIYEPDPKDSNKQRFLPVNKNILHENTSAFQNGEAFCLCSNYEGEIEVRKFSSFTQSHKLSTNEKQAVISVNKAKTIQLRYYLLKGLGLKLSTSKDSEIKGLTENVLLSYFYKSIGYNVKIEERDGALTGYGNWLTDEELKSPQGILLDLVGSDGYAFLRGDNQVHLICKHSNPTEPGIFSTKSIKKITIDKRKIPESLRTAPITAKVNQVNVLFFKNEAIPIKSKFLFEGIGKPETPFNVSYKGIVTKDKGVNEEFYFFKVEGEWDHIDQVISVAKEPLAVDAAADQIQLEQLKISQNYERERHALKQKYIGLEQKLIDIHAERAEGDLNLEEQRKNISVGLAAAGAGLAAIGFAPTLFNKVGKALFPKQQTQPFASQTYWETIAGQTALKEVKALPSFSQQLSRIPKSISRSARNYGIAALGAPIIGRSLTDIFLFQQYKEEQTKRIQEDKDISSQELALDTIRADMAHFTSMRNKALEINSLANQHFQEHFNQASVWAEWKKEKNIDSDVYLLTMIPSKEQLKHIEDYREHYGVQCSIPNQIITMENGMPPNVIRFRNLDEGGIGGLDDIVEREWLKMKLLAQVKVVKIGQEKQPGVCFEVGAVIKDPEDQKIIKGLQEALNDAKTLFNVLKELAHTEQGANGLKTGLSKLKQIREEVKEEVKEEADKLKQLQTDGVQIANPFGDNPTEIVDGLIKLTESLLSKQEERKQLEEQHRKQLEEEKRKEQAAKKLLSEKESELQRCKELQATHLEAKPIQAGSYRDLLSFLHSVNGDVDKIYNKVIQDPYYGLTVWEFINNELITKAQFLHQTIQEIRGLEEDNTSFLPQENSDLRNWLLTPEGQTRVKDIKREFVANWLLLYPRTRALNYPDDKAWQYDKFTSQYYRGTGIKCYGPPKASDMLSGSQKVGSLSGNTNDRCGFPTWSGTYKVAIWDDVSFLNKRMNFIPSFETAREFMQVRYLAGTSGYRYYYDGNHIYYSAAYYDGNQSANSPTPAVFLWSTMYYLLGNSNVLNVNVLGNGVKGRTLFQARPLHGAPNIWNYSGFSNKLYLLGYPIYLYCLLCYHKGVTKKINNQEFKLCCDSVSLGNLKVFKALTVGNTSQSEFLKTIVYPTKVAYRIHVEGQTLDEAIKEVDEEFKNAL